MAGPDTIPALSHRFRDPALLRLALTHRSFGSDHNERLEFIGDGVLNCVVAAELYRRFPELPEGDLSRLRASLVNQQSLHALAVELDLGASLRLGEGEFRSGGAQRPSILADALEALIGAVFVDAGFDAAERAIHEIYRKPLAGLSPAQFGKDPKTRLQEWLQGRRLALPEYAVLATTGEAHAQIFEVACRVPALGVEARASAPNRRAAEQQAAELALARVERG